MSRIHPGDVFAGYTIERELGVGGMGRVYLARHPRLPRHDALKILSADLSDNPSYRRRFEREADIVAALRHQSIVSVHDRGEYDDRLWITLEYIDGHDLGEHTAGNLLPLAAIGQIIEQIADALDTAADHGLTLRDVKPANILLQNTRNTSRPGAVPVALLTDFGIAHVLDDATRLTGTGIAMGTVAFAAPEQLQGHAVDSRADQYSLACTAFTLVTGTEVYSGTSVPAIAMAHVHDPIPMATERSPQRATAAVDAVLTRAMAKDPAQRFPDNRSFAAALIAALHEPPTPEVPTVQECGISPQGLNRTPEQPATQFFPEQITTRFAPTPPPELSTPTPPARRRALLIGALVVVLVLVTGSVGTWLLWPDDGPDDDGTAGPAANRLAVGATLADLKMPRTEPIWRWSPKVLSTARQDNHGIIGGTSNYAIAASNVDSGTAILSVLDAADGTTIRTITLSSNSRVRRCRQLGDTLSTRMICLAYDETAGADDPNTFLVDVVTGAVDTVNVSGSQFMVTGDDYVIASENNSMYAGSPAGKNFTLEGMAVPEAYPLVSGSPVVAVQPVSTGEATLRRITDGTIVHNFPTGGSAESWQPFLNGFVVRRNSDDASTPAKLTFFDARGIPTAEIAGDWTVLAQPTENLIPGHVAATPILLDTARKLIASFDPQTGKVLWQKQYQMDSPSWVNGYGTKVLLGASVNEFEWFDCYDGTGGRIAISRDGRQIGTPMGTDGTRFAVLSRPEDFGATGRLELLTFAPGSPDPLWRMPIPAVTSTPGIAVLGSGKVYAGGELRYGNYRIL